MIWNLWHKRNSRVFDGSHKSAKDLIDAIIREVGGWLFVTKDFQRYCLMDFVRDWKTCISTGSFKAKAPTLD